MSDPVQRLETLVSRVEALAERTERQVLAMQEQIDAGRIQASEPERLLTVEETAEALGFSVHHIRRLLRLGNLRPAPGHTNPRKVFWREVERFKREGARS